MANNTYGNITIVNAGSSTGYTLGANGSWGIGTGAYQTASVTIPTNGYLTGSNYNYSNSGAWTTLSAPSKVNLGNDKMECTEDYDIILGNVSLKHTLTEINKKLNILIPNPKIEKDFPQLRELREQYEALEKELIQQAGTWEILRHTDTE